MTNQINLDITSTFDGSGITAATNGLNGLTKAQGDVSRGAVSATSIMDKWTNAQYASVKVGAQLTDKAIALSSAVNKGTMTVDQARTAWNAYNKEAQKVVWGQMTMSEKANVVATRFNELKTSMAPYVQMAGMVAAGAAAVGVAFQQTYKFSEGGAQIQFTQQKFENLSESIGTTSHIMMNDLRNATGGVYSNMQLMESATNFVGLGLAKTRGEAVRLSAVAAGLGMNMNQLVLTLTNKTTMRFDALGVKVDGFKEKVNALKEAGMDADSAFKEAFLQQAEQQLKLTGGLADSNLGTFMKLKAGWANYTDSIKQETGGWFSGFNISLADTLNRAANVRNIKSNFTEQLSSIGITKADWFANNGRGATGEDFKNAAMAYEASATRYQGLADYYAAGQSVPGMGATVDYAGMLSGGLQLTPVMANIAQAQEKINAVFGSSKNVTEMYRNELLSLHDQYKSGEMTAKEYAEARKQLNQDFRDGTFAAQEQAAAEVQLREQQTNALEQYSMSVLKNAGATDEQMLNFAVASGQISQQAANQQMAMSALSDAYLSGKISAEEYSAAVEKLGNQIKSMDGKKAKAYIDFYINTIGVMPVAGAGANTTNTPHVGTGSGRASGGPLDQRGWTLVGDKPGGQLTPWSELISPSGYVFDAKTTRALIKSGTVGGFASRAEGGTMSAVGQKGDYWQYTPKPTPSNSQDEEIISSATAPMEARAEQNSTAIAQMQVAINTIQAALQDNAAAYGNLAAILTNQNPRAIGKAVAFELSKKFS